MLADGRVIRTGTRAAKSSAGYDLTGLFVGSEGTLGIITELTLRLHGQPEEVAAAVCAFPTLDAAVECVTMTIQSGIPMARIEFVDADAARAFNAFSGAALHEQRHLQDDFHGSPMRRNIGRGRRTAVGSMVRNAPAVWTGRRRRNSARNCGGCGTAPIAPAWRCARARRRW
nr:FAD-linked oxidase C-terminal domain-containing protein [Paracoccus mutanolyticus]